MNTTQLKKHCASYPGAKARRYQAPSNVLVYAVDGRSFAYFKTSVPEKWRFSIRVTPDRFVALTGMPEIKPARYMARYHWVTIVDVRSLPADYLKELVDASYRRVVERLSARRRAELRR